MVPSPKRKLQTLLLKITFLLISDVHSVESGGRQFVAICDIILEKGPLHAGFNLEICGFKVSLR